MAPPIRYHFADFVVSGRQRQVLRNGQALPLIPRYFDLLVLLVERRPNVVTRREIFDRVWGDVIVSDGALSQAIRTLRRTLGDDSREPRFIRTVSRHGYSFVFDGLHEEPDERAPAPPPTVAVPTRSNEAARVIDPPATPDSNREIDALVDQLLAVGGTDAAAEEERRDLAARLHALGTAAALRRLTERGRHAAALAVMRDTRWDVAGAGSVPLWRAPGGLAAARALVLLRAREALRVTRRRWTQAAGGAALAGAMAGVIGGGLLVLAPTSTTPATAVVVLTALGAVAGFVGASGVAAGIASAEAVARSRRGVAIAAGGAAGGLAIGLTARAVVGWTLQSVFGLQVPLGGPVEGLCLGAAVATGYAMTTSRHGGGIARPAGGRRWLVAGVCAAAGGLAAISLSASGRPLVGGMIHAVAQASLGSEVALTPLGAWLGEPAFGPLTQMLVATLEGALFGLGLALGLTRKF